MIKYIGSKRLLLPRILDAVRAAAPPGATVADLFSGTARVGHALKAAGYRVLANDHNAYAHTLATCYVQADAEPTRIPGVRPATMSRRTHPAVASRPSRSPPACGRVPDQVAAVMIAPRSPTTPATASEVIIGEPVTLQNVASERASRMLSANRRSGAGAASSQTTEAIALGARPARRGPAGPAG